MVCNCEVGEREGAKRGGSTHLHNQIKLGSQTERQWGSRIDKKKPFLWIQMKSLQISMLFVREKEERGDE